MLKIESTEHFRRLIQENKHKIGKAETNCFLMTKDVQSFITEGCLFYYSCPDGLLMFVNQQRYYDLYYYWRPDAPFPDLDISKPVSLLEMNRDGRRDIYISDIEKKLFSSGFFFLKTSRLWSLDTCYSWSVNSEWFHDKRGRLISDGFHLLTPVSSDYAKETIHLWETQLDLTDIPADHRLFIDTGGDHTSCLTDADMHVVSAYWWRIGQRNAEGRHIVTSREFMRRGLGRFLLLHCVSTLIEKGIPRLTTYISDANESSICLHRSIGFQPTEKTCNQYILQRK